MIKTTIPRTVTWLQSEDLLPHHDIGPRARAPRLALVANLYGNELNGMFVLSRLAAFLRMIDAGERDGLRLRERVVIIPTINPPNSRDAGARLGGGESADRRRAPWTVTEAVAEMTRSAYYRVNIHPASLDIEEIPQVHLYAPNDDERASACLFGLPAVIERPMEDEMASGLVRAWRSHGGESFVIQAGQAGGLQTGHCETLFRALVAFLDRTGMMGGLKLAEEEEDLHYFGLRQVFAVLAEQPGLFSSHLEVGRWVRAGEELGYIYDDFTGGVQARVLAPVNGLLASLRRQPLLGEGELVARILTPDALVQRNSARRTGGRHDRRFGRRL